MKPTRVIVRLMIYGAIINVPVWHKPDVTPLDAAIATLRFRGQLAPDVPREHIKELAVRVEVGEEEGV